MYSKWLLIFILSLVWVVFLFFYGSPVFNLRPNLQDHVSNIYTSQLFWKEGFEIYKKGPEHFLDTDTREASQAEATRLGVPLDDVLRWRDDPEAPPLFIVWPWMPRPYPPGSSLMFTPFSQLVGLGLPLYWVLGFCIFTLLMGAHLCFFSIREYMTKFQMTSWQNYLGILLQFFVYQELVVWALCGMYDVMSFLFLALAVISFLDRRWFLTIFFYCLSFFLHYRALYWVPLPLLAFYYLFLDKKSAIKWEKVNFNEKILFGLSIAMGLLGLYSFFLTYGSLQNDYLQMKNNPFFWFNGAPLDIRAFAGWVILLLGYSVYAFKKKDWIPVVFLIWISIMLIKMPFVKSWYVLFLLPLLILGLRKEVKSWGSLFWGLPAYAYLSGTVFVNSPFEFYLWNEVLNLMSGVGH